MLPFFESRNNTISFFSGVMHDFPPHFHKEVELFYVTEGTLELKIGGKHSFVNKGDLAVIFPNEIHEYIGGKNNKHTTIIFDPLMCPDFFSVFLNSIPEESVIRYEAQSNELRETLISLITILGTDDSVSEILIKGYLTILLYYALKCVSVESGASVKNPDIVAQVINYVSAHYLEQISLESISVTLGYSKYEISRVFSKKIGIQFNEYLNSLRAEHATALLKNTSKPIIEIAFASGFESLRTFYRVFSNKYNVSPVKYRMSYSAEL